MKGKLEIYLDFCEECFQMTNHINEKCQKCKAKINKISNYDEDDISNYRIKT
jgi:hypothetical protein